MNAAVLTPLRTHERPDGEAVSVDTHGCRLTGGRRHTPAGYLTAAAPALLESLVIAAILLAVGVATVFFITALAYTIAGLPQTPPAQTGEALSGSSQSPWTMEEPQRNNIPAYDAVAGWFQSTVDGRERGAPEREAASPAPLVVSRR